MRQKVDRDLKRPKNAFLENSFFSDFWQFLDTPKMAPLRPQKCRSAPLTKDKVVSVEAGTRRDLCPLLASKESKIGPMVGSLWQNLGGRGGSKMAILAKLTKNFRPPLRTLESQLATHDSYARSETRKTHVWIDSDSLEQKYRLYRSSFAVSGPMLSP